ncbi:hypothetical protein Phi18:2_gp24 [Cellulophaga phage phi18:2]|uniref:Uncharacterized protein n=2 Tax=Cellulophaga phage phi18:1 TaxID=1327982 RepID=S0A427_9CAUD|nr:hypothetical protein Phi18:1_gp24 [Cellulophaga phage phi18:1]AGO48471.1 hypothetical protein Phi18:1_gp24 [Cellulophaga phage phi18:1]AGO49187.1 hypothetical protein Phi18:2_gp24 [Cellulophaga phage phi18:2]
MKSYILDDAGRLKIMSGFSLKKIEAQKKYPKKCPHCQSFNIYSTIENIENDVIKQVSIICNECMETAGFWEDGKFLENDF